MFELLIVVGVGFIVFAFFMFVLMLKNKSEEKTPASGCCGNTDSKEKIGCAHCSGHINIPPKLSSEDQRTL
jgi:hypothetical protein